MNQDRRKGKSVDKVPAEGMSMEMTLAGNSGASAHASSREPSYEELFDFLKDLTHRTSPEVQLSDARLLEEEAPSTPKRNAHHESELADDPNLSPQPMFFLSNPSETDLASSSQSLSPNLTLPLSDAKNLDPRQHRGRGGKASLKVSIPDRESVPQVFTDSPQDERIPAHPKGGQRLMPPHQADEWQSPVGSIGKLAKTFDGLANFFGNIEIFARETRGQRHSPETVQELMNSLSVPGERELEAGASALLPELARLRNKGETSADIEAKLRPILLASPRFYHILKGGTKNWAAGKLPALVPMMLINKGVDEVSKLQQVGRVPQEGVQATEEAIEKGKETLIASGNEIADSLKQVSTNIRKWAQATKKDIERLDVSPFSDHRRADTIKCMREHRQEDVFDWDTPTFIGFFRRTRKENEVPSHDQQYLDDLIGHLTGAQVTIRENASDQEKEFYDYLHDYLQHNFRGQENKVSKCTSTVLIDGHPSNAFLLTKTEEDDWHILDEKGAGLKLGIFPKHFKNFLEEQLEKNPTHATNIPIAFQYTGPKQFNDQTNKPLIDILHVDEDVTMHRKASAASGVVSTGLQYLRIKAPPPQLKQEHVEGIVRWPLVSSILGRKHGLYSKEIGDIVNRAPGGRFFCPPEHKNLENFLNDKLRNTRRGLENRQDIVGLELYRQYGGRVGYAESGVSSAIGAGASFGMGYGANAAVKHLSDTWYGKLAGIALDSMVFAVPEALESTLNLLPTLKAEETQRGGDRSLLQLTGAAVFDSSDPARHDLKELGKETLTASVIGGGMSIPLNTLHTCYPAIHPLFEQVAWGLTNVGNASSIPLTHASQLTQNDRVLSVNLKRGNYKLPTHVEALNDDELAEWKNTMSLADYGNQLIYAGQRKSFNQAFYLGPLAGGTMQGVAMSVEMAKVVDSLKYAAGQAARKTPYEIQETYTPPLETIITPFASASVNNEFDRKIKQLRFHVTHRRSQGIGALPHSELAGYSGAYQPGAHTPSDFVRDILRGNNDYEILTKSDREAMSDDVRERKGLVAKPLEDWRRDLYDARHSESANALPTLATGSAAREYSPLGMIRRRSFSSPKRADTAPGVSPSTPQSERSLKFLHRRQGSQSTTASDKANGR